MSPPFDSPLGIAPFMPGALARRSDLDALSYSSVESADARSEMSDVSSESI